MKHLPPQLPLNLQSAHKTDVRIQFGALCFRNKNKTTRVCLITSRDKGRWIVPKGWPTNNTTPAQSAAIEALEEAGLRGISYNQCIGAVSNVKDTPRGALQVIMMIYPLEVTDILKNWPEKPERRRKWFGCKEAAQMVSEPDLKLIIRHFNPATLIA